MVLACTPMPPHPLSSPVLRFPSYFPSLSSFLFSPADLPGRSRCVLRPQQSFVSTSIIFFPFFLARLSPSCCLTQPLNLLVGDDGSCVVMDVGSACPARREVRCVVCRSASACEGVADRLIHAYCTRFLSSFPSPGCETRESVKQTTNPVAYVCALQHRPC